MSTVRLLIAIALSLTLTLSGCTSKDAEPAEGSAVESVVTPAGSAEVEAEPKDEPDSEPEPAAEEASPKLEPAPASEPAPEPESTPAYLTWDATHYPDYYTVTGPADYDSSVQPGTKTYASLDSLGRAAGATACITGAQRAAARDDQRDSDSPDVDPSGWPAENQISIIPGITQNDYRGYLWNRSHLLADSLGGDAIAQNLITGTRSQNVGQRNNQGGMAYCETLVRDYLDAHPNGWVYYRAVPVYEGSEPIARGVWVDMRSDDGSIDQRVFVFNAANGYEIDYSGASATGWSSTSVESPAPAPATDSTDASASTSGPASPVPAGTTYILNTNTGKFHLPGCSSVKQMSEKNKQTFTGTRDEAIAQGYSPCGRCNP